MTKSAVRKRLRLIRKGKADRFTNDAAPWKKDAITKRSARKVEQFYQGAHWDAEQIKLFAAQPTPRD